MPRILLIAFVIAVTFWVVSIVDVSVQPSNRHRGLSKTGWVVVVLLIPVIGGLLWFAIGRVRKRAIRQSNPESAPDDDASFLGSIGSIADQDERIRRLEEELAQLDAEDDDPRWRPPHATDDQAQAPVDQPDADDDEPRGRSDRRP